MSQKKISHKTYQNLLSGISGILHEARKASARAVNTILTVTYWEIGRCIVEFEQKGNLTASYGEEIIERLAVDLTKRFGRGFSRRNLFQIRMFYVYYAKKFQIVSGISRRQKVQTVSAQLPGFFIKNI
ncbi:MAG: DUF1016 N-terminal domain-containing protein [Candidatus Bathyarchaeota archaeon]